LRTPISAHDRQFALKLAKKCLEVLLGSECAWNPLCHLPRQEVMRSRLCSPHFGISDTRSSKDTVSSRERSLNIGRAGLIGSDVENEVGH